LSPNDGATIHMKAAALSLQANMVDRVKDGFDGAG
jgi:hypothetical protein